LAHPDILGVSVMNKKTQDLKKIMRRNCNFSNVPWSLSSHHQKLVGLDISSNRQDNNHYFDKIDDFTVHIHHQPIDVSCAWWTNIAYQSTNLRENSKYQPLKSLTIAGRLCKAQTIFVRYLPNFDSKVAFFRIAESFVSGTVFLVMEELETICFCHGHFSFIVQPKNMFLVVLREELVFRSPMYSFNYEKKFM
jgi:hypothetical protein